MITQSRHILLDFPLIFFTALTTFLWVGFCNEDKPEPFTESWWTWLTLSGLSFGAVLSCKCVWLFTVATVGVSTLYQLWNLFGDLRVPPRLFAWHFLARALCLIVVPIFFYMAMFEIHFLILENSGRWRQVHEFRIPAHPRQSGNGRHIRGHHCQFLSHYSSRQHQDSNNDFRIFNVTLDGVTHFDWENSPLEYITPWMRIQLHHIATENISTLQRERLAQLLQTAHGRPIVCP